MFKKVDPNPSFPALENEILARWESESLLEKYLSKNNNSDSYYSFLDGPITANNPMGVHHAWGRTYKDMWQRFYNLKGYKQRFQNGFDCQGLWVEVEVEKELEIRNKKEIENLVAGDKNASIAKFVQLCKDRVLKFAAVQTDQSKRLGYFMDWDNSYFTMSDENNYMIWLFLKKCMEHGWIYKGHDAVPWCPRCETAISQHEMLTEDYKEATHESIFVTLPLVDEKYQNTSLLVWTTTPWTMPANVAVGVNAEYTYGIWTNENGQSIIFLDTDNEGNAPVRSQKKKSVSIDEYVFKTISETYTKTGVVKGADLIGLKYQAAFDDLDVAKGAESENPAQFHTVVDASDLVNAEEGTGLLHLAPGAGTDDFRLGKKLGLPVISVINDDASYHDGLGEFTGKSAKKHPELIIDALRNRHGKNWLFKTEQYTHRYPACWRCKKELVWKVADEWYISMDTPSVCEDEIFKGKTFRELMIGNAQKINWIPDFGLQRELDWLNNMEDWLISKKNRYWGLALPIFECEKCQTFEVVGSKDELRERAVEGWDEFDGHSPHKPYIDMVKIACRTCGDVISRVDDVGNPWLDAGIVPYSTISSDNSHTPLYTSDKKEWKKWFPADFITESFPGQFKNWFYALIAMSSALEDEAPFKTVLGFGTLLDETGRAMHKSWGNSIEFKEGADKIGVDVMRWMYARTNPADNMLFGYKIGDEVRRTFLLMLWNIYKFFIEYALLDGYQSSRKVASSHVLDSWISHRVNQTVLNVEKGFENHDVRLAAHKIEELIQDISTWYIRQSRSRLWSQSDNIEDKMSFYSTMHYVLETLVVMISPIAPFVSDEIYRNITDEESVHLASWPKITDTIDEALISKMENIRELIELAHRERKELGIKVRQPLARVTFNTDTVLDKELLLIVKNELNVKEVECKKTSSDMRVEYDTNITQHLKDEGDAREIIRNVQKERRAQSLNQEDVIKLTLPEYPESFAEYIQERTNAKTLIKGEKLHIELV